MDHEAPSEYKRCGAFLNDDYVLLLEYDDNAICIVREGGTGRTALLEQALRLGVLYGYEQGKLLEFKIPCDIFQQLKIYMDAD